MDGDFEAVGAYLGKNRLIVREIKNGDSLAECRSVLEETAAFFDGQQSAEEAAAAVAERTRACLNE